MPATCFIPPNRDPRPAAITTSVIGMASLYPTRRFRHRRWAGAGVGRQLGSSGPEVDVGGLPFEAHRTWRRDTEEDVVGQMTGLVNPAATTAAVVALAGMTTAVGVLLARR